MHLSATEFRFRYLLHALVYGLGFWAPWDRLLPRGSSLAGHQSAWLALAAFLARFTNLSFPGATVSLLVAGIVCAATAAALRTWAAACLGAFRVTTSSMIATHVVAQGPYRHLRNPLYLGTMLHSVALALLMPPTGAVFALLAIAFLQARLIAGEERFLATTLGAPYLAYRATVPRILPSLTPAVPSSATGLHWGSAILAETYMIGAAVVFAAFGWRYNAFLLIKGIVIALGLSIVARAFLPRVATQASDSKAPAQESGF